jgi:hypothetical protein
MMSIQKHIEWFDAMFSFWKSLDEKYASGEGPGWYGAVARFLRQAALA